MIALNTSASDIQTRLQASASLPETACALRWKTPKSSANMANTNTLNPIHNQSGVSITSPFGSSRNSVVNPAHFTQTSEEPIFLFGRGNKNETPRPDRGSLANSVLIYTYD